MRSNQAWDWDEIARQCLREARRMTRTHDDAEDVAQEALLRAWRHRDRCREPQARSAWVARICHNEARRPRPGARESPALLDDEALVAPTGDPVDRLERLSLR